MTMQPGPELDKVVCEIVGIPVLHEYKRDANGIMRYNDHYPHVSTSFTVHIEKILEWMKNTKMFWCLQNANVFNEPEGWACQYEDAEGNAKTSEQAQTIQHAVCLAVVEIDKARKKA